MTHVAWGVFVSKTFPVPRALETWPRYRSGAEEGTEPRRRGEARDALLHGGCGACDSDEQLEVRVTKSVVLETTGGADQSDGLGADRRGAHVDDEKAVSAELPRAALAVLSTGAADQLNRLSRMTGLLRRVETELAFLMPRDSLARDAHDFRIARAHALALIDALGDISAAVTRQ